MTSHDDYPGPERQSGTGRARRSRSAEAARLADIERARALTARERVFLALALGRRLARLAPRGPAGGNG